MSYIEVSNFGAQKVIDVAHHEVHAGDSFRTEIQSTDFDKSDELGILFKTADVTDYVNMIFEASCGTDANFQVLEDPTVDVANYVPGSRNPINRNRNSSNTSQVLSIAAVPVANTVSLKLVSDVASPITADGTKVFRTVFGGNKTFLEVSSRSQGELILKADTIYYFRLKGLGTGTDNEFGYISLVWYEHTDKTDQELLDESFDGQVISRAMRFKSY